MVFGGLNPWFGGVLGLGSRWERGRLEEEGTWVVEWGILGVEVGVLGVPERGLLVVDLVVYFANFSVDFAVSV